MAEQNLGIIVCQRHCVEPALKERRLQLLDAEKASAVEQNIYLVELEEIVHPQRVRAVIEAFWQMKKPIKPRSLRVSPELQSLS